MDKELIEKLAQLSRLDLKSEEIDKYSTEIGDILQYVDILKKASADNQEIIFESSPTRNVLREDENPHQSGIHTDDLLESAPESDNGFVKVKKIL